MVDRGPYDGKRDRVVLCPDDGFEVRAIDDADSRQLVFLQGSHDGRR